MTRHRKFDIVKFINNKLPPWVTVDKKYYFELTIFSNHSYDLRVCYELKSIDGKSDGDLMWEHKFIKDKNCDFLTLTENAKNETDLRDDLVWTYNFLVEHKIIKGRRVKSVCDHINESTGLKCIAGRCQKCGEIV